jgi:hypothetical protein
MKQGWEGYGRKKALRGSKNLRVQLRRARQTRYKSLPVTKALKGTQTSRESVSFPQAVLLTRLRCGGERDGAGRVTRSSGAKGQERRVELLPRRGSRTDQENLMVHPRRRSTQRWC